MVYIPGAQGDAVRWSASRKVDSKNSSSTHGTYVGSANSQPFGQKNGEDASVIRTQPVTTAAVFQPQSHEHPRLLGAPQVGDVRDEERILYEAPWSGERVG